MIQCSSVSLCVHALAPCWLRLRVRVDPDGRGEERRGPEDGTGSSLAGRRGARSTTSSGLESRQTLTAIYSD